MLGWKTYEYYYETDELPDPRPTQPKKNEVKSGIWVTFSHSKQFFVRWDWFSYRKQTARNVTQPNSPEIPQYTKKKHEQKHEQGLEQTLKRTPTAR